MLVIDRLDALQNERVGFLQFLTIKKEHIFVSISIFEILKISNFKGQFI